jgi:tetratricopeptide (TPR) repeat protein
MKVPLPPRRLIPKWRPVASTLKTTEAKPTLERKPEEFTGNADEFEKAVNLWLDTKEPGVLGDVLSFSVHPELNERAIRIGEEALRIGAQVTQAQKSLIRDIRDEPMIIQSGANFPFQRPIQKLRDILRNTPDNPLALLDYAQFQLAVGKKRASERALMTALSLSPNNRIILRTLARFLVHVKEAEHAHRLIYRHANTLHDPWLMASEIALANAAGTKSRFIMPGRQYLKTRLDINPAHITELAGAIAIEELHSGHMKRARESYMRALFAPNDNVIAQAVTCREEFGLDLHTQTVTQAIQLSSEALTLQAMFDFKPKLMMEHALNWHAEESFSSRPIQLLATTYAYIGDFAIGLQWIQAGLLANPNDPGLLVSLAYIQAQLGKEKESFAAMQKLLNIDAAYSPYCKATTGLIHYSHGRYEIGDSLYESAIIEFNKTNRHAVGTFCLINQVFSAADYNHPEINRIIASAQMAMKEHPSQDALLLLNVRSNKYLLGEQPENKKLRRMTQWFFDPASNTLFEKKGLTAPGAEPLIMLNRT